MEIIVKKKYYEEPTVEVILFTSQDILGDSSGDNDMELPGTENPGWEEDWNNW